MSSNSNKRIAKNTLILYVRMFFIMCVSLYTSRIVINALGIDDYGVYTVIGGFVAMFGIISNSLTAAISRFITYELGRDNNENLKNIFTGAILIQVVISIIILLIAETLGVWFLNSRMNIPSGQIYAANWVLQFSIVTFIVNLISVPYNAAIIAHERMAAFAYISIFDVLCKLGIAFLILISPISRLIAYSFLLCLLSIITRLIYNIYCKRNFDECRFNAKYDKAVIKQIFSFAGWNFIGASSGLLRDQGINVLLNLFCGPAVNAARGISMQVSSAVSQFTGSFTTAINPQITKQFAQGNDEGWSRLVFWGSRFSCFLLLIPSIPIFFEANPLLHLWLKTVPPYSVIFVQLIIVYIFVETISCTLITLMLATGNIRNYQLIVGGCQMLNFPVAYMLLKLDFPPQSTIVGSIVIAIGCLILRLAMLRRMVHLDVLRFCSSVVFKTLWVATLSAFLPILMRSMMKSTLLDTLIIGFSSVIWTAIIIIYVGCNKYERSLIIHQIQNIKKRLYANK